MNGPEPASWWKVPLDGNYEIKIGEQTLARFEAREGERVEVWFIPQVPAWKRHAKVTS